MKGKLTLISLGAIAVAIAGFAVAVYAAEAPAQNELAALVQGETQKYVLRSGNGKLTVFSENPEIPEIETEIDISRLRQYDRELLEQGIGVEGYEQMISLLEDFSN